MKKKILKYQQGGVTPITAPEANLGQTAPLLTQVASQPIDSGVGAIVQFSQLAQRRHELEFQEYSFEVERQLQEKNFDLQREMFEWKKETWALEFDENLKQQARNNILVGMGLLEQYQAGNPQTLAGKNGVANAPQNFQNPGQVRAAEEAEQRALPAYEKIAEWMIGDPREDPGAIKRIQNEYRAAYTTDDYIAATNQRTQYENQAAEYKANPDKYDPYLMEYNQLKYMQEKDVNAPVNMLYVSSEHLITEIAEQFKDRYYQPEMVDIGHGFYLAMQENIGMQEDVVQALKSDPTGTYAAKFAMELDQGKVPEDMDYQTWLDQKVRHDLTMYDPTQGKYKVIGTPQQPKGSGDGGSPTANFHGDTVTGRQSILSPQMQTSKPRPPEADWISAGSNDVELDPSATYSGLQDVNPELITGDAALVASRGMLPAGSEGGERTGKRIDPKNPEKGNNYIRSLAYLVEGTPVGEVDLTKYVDEEGYLTDAGMKLYKDSQKKESLKLTPTIHRYDQEGILGKKNNKTEYQLRNEEFNPKISEHLFLDPYADKDQMLDIDQFNEWMGESEDYELVGYMDSRNIASLVAEQHNDGTFDPMIYGVEPQVMVATNDKGNTRTFLIPQRKEVLETEGWKQKYAQHKAFVQATIGKGNVIMADFDPKAVPGLIHDLTLDQRSEMGYEDHAKMVTDLSSSLVGVQAVEGAEGEIAGMGYHFNGEGGRGDGRLVVTNPEFEGIALSTADMVRKNLSAGDTFDLTQGYESNSRRPFFYLEVNGEPQEIIYPVMDKDGYIDQVAFNNQIERATQFAGKPFTELQIRETGMIDGFMAMTPLPQDTTLVPRFHKKFLSEFQKLDTMLAAAGYNYTFTSMWRNEPDKAHDGRAADLRYRPGVGNLDAFFKGLNPDFKGSEPGEFDAYQIPGTQLWVARHDNRGSEGQHYHVYMNEDPTYVPARPGRDVAEPME